MAAASRALFLPLDPDLAADRQFLPGTCGTPISAIRPDNRSGLVERLREVQSNIGHLMPSDVDVQQVVEAEGSLLPGTGVRSGSSPDSEETGQHGQMVRSGQSIAGHSCAVVA